jgi:hypothetical protein
VEDLFYISKKNKKVNLLLTTHARNRFMERYNRVFPHKKLTEETLDDCIRVYWNYAILKKTNSKILRNRAKKYKGDTLYFVSFYFTFVVENSTIVTIELSSKNTKHLNHKPRKYLINIMRGVN